MGLYVCYCICIADVSKLVTADLIDTQNLDEVNEMFSLWEKDLFVGKGRE